MRPPPNWEPWQRQEGEPDFAFAHFQSFLAIPNPRDLRALSKIKGFPLTFGQLDLLAWEWFWIERARLWDSHLDEIRRSTIEDITRQSAEQVAHRHLRALGAMQDLGLAEIGKLLQISKENDAPGVVSARDALRYLGTGIRLERLVRGETTEKIEQGPDLSACTPEDLRKLRELQAKAGIR